MRISDWSSDVCSSDLFTTYIRAVVICGQCMAVQGIDIFYDSEKFPGYSKAPERCHGGIGEPLSEVGFGRSEERRVGKECSVRVDLGGRRIIKKKNTIEEQLQVT